MNRPIIWICRRWTPWLMRWMNSLELYLSVVNLGGSHVSVMMKKSGILVVEDGTLAAFPVTFEEDKEELQSDIKAEVVPMKLLVLPLNYSFLLGYVHRKVMSGSNIVAIKDRLHGIY